MFIGVKVNVGVDHADGVEYASRATCIVYVVIHSCATFHGDEVGNVLVGHEYRVEENFAQVYDERVFRAGVAQGELHALQVAFLIDEHGVCACGRDGDRTGERHAVAVGVIDVIVYISRIACCAVGVAASRNA